MYEVIFPHPELRLHVTMCGRLHLTRCGPRVFYQMV